MKNDVNLVTPHFISMLHFRYSFITNNRIGISSGSLEKELNAKIDPLE